jgi:hypothetical protein
MKKNIALILLSLSITSLSVAQGKYFTRNGTLTFFSKTPVENIEAVNHQASSIFDTASGDIAVSAQMKGFEFEKALMQEHFNENYVESDKFPKATFKGQVVNFSLAAIPDNAPVEVEVKGILNVHGVDKEITTKGSLTKKENSFEAFSTFHVSAADFDIKIPKAVINNIAEKIEVTIHLQLEPYVQ